MCLISVVPKGIKKDIDLIKGFIENGMSGNSDGSGFMYKRNGTTIIGLEKGFRDPILMVSAIKALKLKLEDELVIHHRTGTSGERNDVNMHPFYVSADDNIINTIHGKYNIPAMAHNGVFSEFTDRTSKYNDTWHFVNSFIALPQITDMVANHTELFKKVFRSLLIGEKLAFLFPNSDLVMTGIFTEDDGCFHSNSGYKTIVYDYGGQGHHRSFGRNNLRDHMELVDGHWVRKDRAVRNLQTSVLDGDDDTNTCAYENIREKAIVKGGIESGVRLSGIDIELTEENYRDFILILQKPFNQYGIPAIMKGKVFVIEDYVKDTLLNHIVSFTSSKEIFHVDVNRFFKECTIYIKKEKVTPHYAALGKLVTASSVIGIDSRMITRPSDSMLKKISKSCSKNYLKKEFQYKDYGLFKREHLKYFLENHSINQLKALQELNNLLDEGVPNQNNAIVAEDLMS